MAIRRRRRRKNTLSIRSAISRLEANAKRAERDRLERSFARQAGSLVSDIFTPSIGQYGAELYRLLQRALRNI